MLAVAPAPAGPDEYAHDVATTLVVLARLRGTTLGEVVEPTLLDDLDAVLESETGPSAESLPVLAKRFDEVLAEVLELLPFRVPPPQAEAVMHQAGRLIGQPLPDDYVSALGLLRRVAVVVQHGLDLLDRGGDV